MIFSITNPTELVDRLQIFCKSGWLSPWDPPLQWRKNPRKKLPPRNTPDSFCRRFAPTKSIAALLGRYFSFSGKIAPWKFHEPTGRDTDFSSTPLQNRGRNCVRCERWPTYMSSTTSTYFYALTIRKHLSKVDFERSGRGQEPSRGHKLSILENVVLHRDFTSATLVRFRSASCWGVPAPNPAE